MHYPDLSKNSYIGDCPYVRSIGWLSSEHSYTTGRAPKDLTYLLENHLKNHWACFAAAGQHDCEICLLEGKVHWDSRNLFIPAQIDLVYLTPGMIVHYIKKHNYLPPEEFIEAVRNCPPQGSDPFMALMANFGKWWDSQF